MLVAYVSIPFQSMHRHVMPHIYDAVWSSCRKCLYTNPDRTGILYLLKRDSMSIVSSSARVWLIVPRSEERHVTTLRLMSDFRPLPSSSPHESRPTANLLYNLNTDAGFTELLLGVLCIISYISVGVFPIYIQNCMLTLIFLLSKDVIIFTQIS